MNSARRQIGAEVNKGVPSTMVMDSYEIFFGLVCGQLIFYQSWSENTPENTVQKLRKVAVFCILRDFPTVFWCKSLVLDGKRDPGYPGQDIIPFPPLLVPGFPEKSMTTHNSSKHIVETWRTLTLTLTSTYVYVCTAVPDFPGSLPLSQSQREKIPFFRLLPHQNPIF